MRLERVPYGSTSRSSRRRVCETCEVPLRDDRPCFGNKSVSEVQTMLQGLRSPALRNYACTLIRLNALPSAASPRSHSGKIRTLACKDHQYLYGLERRARLPVWDLDIFAILETVMLLVVWLADLSTIQVSLDPASSACLVPQLISSAPMPCF